MLIILVSLWFLCHVQYILHIFQMETFQSTYKSSYLYNFKILRIRNSEFQTETLEKKVI